MGCAGVGSPLPGVVGRPLLAVSDPLRAIQLKLPKKSECRKALTPHPFSRQLLPILQKLEFGAGFHVPNHIVPGFGPEKTERREYLPLTPHNLNTYAHCYIN